MRLRDLLAGAVLTIGAILMIGSLRAQTTLSGSSFGWGINQGSPTCGVPTTGYSMICATTDPAHPYKWSINGAPYIDMPIGQPGPKGDKGDPGTPGTFPTSFQCEMKIAFINGKQILTCQNVQAIQ
jgi:hypothetical protein